MGKGRAWSMVGIAITCRGNRSCQTGKVMWKERRIQGRHLEGIENGPITMARQYGRWQTFILFSRFDKSLSFIARQLLPVFFTLTYGLAIVIDMAACVVRVTAKCCWTVPEQACPAMQVKKHYPRAPNAGEDGPGKLTTHRLLGMSCMYPWSGHVLYLAWAGGAMWRSDLI
jgi:hypothetical protein